MGEEIRKDVTLILLQYVQILFFIVVHVPYQCSDEFMSKSNE